MQSSSLDSTPPAHGPPVHALNTGERRWLAELYEANYGPVVRLCTRLLRNGEDAADAAQDVFLIAANSLDPSAPPGQARAWLLTVARNHCLDALRRRTRLGKALITLGSQPDPSRDLEGAGDRGPAAGRGRRDPDIQHRSGSRATRAGAIRYSPAGCRRRYGGDGFRA